MVNTKTFIIVFISLVLCFTYLPHSNAATDWDQKFSQRINNWITEIATQNSSFTNWLDANWTSQSFGPNSKQWLISIYSENLTVGHLVVGEDEAGQLFIVEYGFGYLNH